MGKNIGLIIYPDDFKDLLEMSDAETGMVIKNVIRFFQEEEVPEFEDRYLVKVYRDMTDRISRAEKRYHIKAEAGSKGGKISSKNKQTQADLSKGQANVSKGQADSSRLQADLSKLKQTQAPIPIPKPIPKPKPNNSFVEEIVHFLNEKTGKHFQPKGETERLINGRLNEGYTVDDFKKVITIKCNEWKDDPKYSRYLQPSTLFAPSHFDEYLNQPEKVTKPSLVKPNQFTEMEKRKDYDMDALMQKLVKN